MDSIKPEIEKILPKNPNAFRRKQSTTSQILTIRRIIKGVRAKNLEATLLFIDFSKEFDSIHGWKMEQILRAYGLPKENVTAIMMFYRNSKSLLTRWRHRLLWHCCWCSTRGYISPISVHNLPRLCTSNLDRSISKTIQIRRIRHVVHRWRSKDEFMDLFTRTCQCRPTLPTTAL